MVIGSFLALSIAGTAKAQLPGTAIRASIPFAFSVRGRTLPAGNYVITRVTDEPVGLIIQNVDYKSDKAMFETEPIYVGARPHKDVLVFHRYGESYFLSEVVTSTEQTARELFPSRDERRMKRDMAKNQVQAETVTVASN